MYTIVIADDEEELRKAIIRNLNWEAIGFQVVGEAENGIDALELVEKLEPDLLLTDIKMPFVSGIELARQVREISPAMNIAFLSGYDDFKLAQQAIQYNIISYLLKPISADELSAELIQIREKMDQKIEHLRKSKRTEEESKKLEFLMPLLLDGIQNYQNKKEEEKANAFYRKQASELGFSHMGLPISCYNIMVTRFETMDDKEDLTNPDLTAFVDEVVKKYIECGSFYANGKIITLTAGSERDLDKYLPILTKEVMQNSRRVLNARCYMGVSRYVHRLTECRTAYMEAMTALHYSEEGEEDIHFIMDIEQNSDVAYEQMEDWSNELETLLKGGKKEELEDFLSMIYKKMDQESHNINREFLVLRIITTVYQSVNAVQAGSFYEEIAGNLTFLNKIFIDDSPEKIQKELTNFCFIAKDQISSQRKMNAERLSEQVLEIIKKEYENPELGVAELSKRLCVSPNYLSTVVKKYGGDTFTNLLTERRMNVAKERLMCTSMKVLEIAHDCGYLDQHYFSYCFKKYFGVSPNKMRESQS